MEPLLDQATALLQEAQQLEPKEALARLREATLLLEAVRPDRERDGLLALAFLRQAQLQRQLGRPQEAERAFVSGYSYARSSREERVRRLAERLREEFGY